MKISDMARTAGPKPAGRQAPGRLGRIGWAGVVSLSILLIIVAVGVIAPMLWQQAVVTLDVPHAFQPPSGSHLFGTDELGRDVLLRTLVATRLSLGLALLATVIACVAGIGFGTMSALSGPRMKRIAGSVIDLSLSLPNLLLAIVVVVALGSSGTTAAIAIGVSYVPHMARLAFNVASSVAEKDYVVAGRVLGLSRARLVVRYIWPNCLDSLAVLGLAVIGGSVTGIAALSFLGLGSQPPNADWGTLLTEGIRNFYTLPMQALAPALIIGVTGLSVALFSDAFAKVLREPGRGR